MFGPSYNLVLSWRDLTVKTKRKSRGYWSSTNETILDNVSGQAESGSLVAVMGASGCGKTTFLATVSKRLKCETEGQVLLNGKPVDHKLMMRISGFVPQKDITITTLTVQEHMNFMCEMRMDQAVKTGVRHKWIDRLLLEMGLRGCVNTQLRALSGGERKRLMLAVELLTDPLLLFCDEPTTGLDSYNALTVVEKLRQLAEKGKVILCSIHQPASDVFHCFTELTLLATGRVAYHGPRAHVHQHFARLGYECPPTYNLADFLMRQLSLEPDKEEESLSRIRELCAAFNISHQQQCRPPGDISAVLQKYSSIEKPSWFNTLRWLTWRSALDSSRTKMGHFMQVAVFMVTSIILAAAYMNIDSSTQEGIQDVRGLLYLIISEIYFTCAYRVLYTFPSEIPVFLRESNLYPASAYYMAKFITQIPRLIIEPMVFLGLICVLRMIGGGGGIIHYWLLIGPLLVSAYGATAYGCMMSSVFESVDVATALAVPLDLLALLMAGMFYNIRSLPEEIQWLKYLSQLYYTNEIVAVLHWQEVHEIGCFEDTRLPCYRNGSQVLEEYGFLPENVPVDIAALVLFCLVLNVAGFIGILRRSKKEGSY